MTDTHALPVHVTPEPTQSHHRFRSAMFAAALILATIAVTLISLAIMSDGPSAPATPKVGASVTSNPEVCPLHGFC